MRLYARAKLDEIQSMNLKIAQSFFDKAEKHSSDPMPGYTPTCKEPCPQLGVYGLELLLSLFLIMLTYYPVHKPG